jgi:hypothetical protein
MQIQKLFYKFIICSIVINTAMICFLTLWSIEDSKSLKNLQSDIKELRRALDTEIKLRQEILPQLKKSAEVLSKYNPSLDYFTALTYALKIYACSDSDVPFDILTALIIVESNADHKAVSSKGALGLTQVMPGIWDQDKNVLTNPYTNIEVGASILKYYIKRHGLIEGLRAYNSGSSGIGNKKASTVFAQKIVTIANEHF